ncbi:hypothetical protein PPACK8108_LOCUS16418 [Phakopsora pachyrhizi]|uniref:tRNA-splicing endonuclease subunit Sen34 n=1 Tax=Phakopsora pachyrhizi TaxID=170000 RepID=A0AAV0B998_PHAPC|nr:hypothetical protein PPACK8108_LOCUS16418 [Phakopsora pachyrhizi]
MQVLFLILQDKIPICISNGKAYVWDIDHVRRLRVDHQICGLLTGTLPQLAQQNVFLGLPLELMPEEVFSLAKSGIAILIDEKQAHRAPTLEEASLFKAKEDTRIAHDIRILTLREAERRAAMKDQYRSEIEKAAEIKQAQNAQSKDFVVSKLNDDPAFTEISGSQALKSPVPEIHHRIPVKLLSERPSYSQEGSCSFNDLDSACANGLWEFPTEGHQRARCEVFDNLWKRGMFLGLGLKFGCDFLVYPGDSLRFHSHFACTVISDPLRLIEPLAIVSYGRLATAVKKSHLLACWDEETDEVRYMSLEWAGIG